MDQTQEVMEIIDDLYSMVSEAWGVPLGNEKCIVERDKLLNLLDEIKDKLPSELAQARRLVETRNEFISNAKHEAENIRHQAEERARVLVSEQEVVRVAEARSSEMLASTEQKVNQLRQAASSFCAQALQETEQAIAEARQTSEQAIAAAVQTAQQAIAAAVQQTDAQLRTALQNVQNTRAGVTNAFGAAEARQRAQAQAAAQARREAESQPKQEPLPQAEFTDEVEE